MFRVFAPRERICPITGRSWDPVVLRILAELSCRSCHVVQATCLQLPGLFDPAVSPQKSVGQIYCVHALKIPRPPNGGIPWTAWCVHAGRASQVQKRWEVELSRGRLFHVIFFFPTHLTFYTCSTRPPAFCRFFFFTPVSWCDSPLKSAEPAPDYKCCARTLANKITALPASWATLFQINYSKLIFCPANRPSPCSWSHTHTDARARARSSSGTALAGWHFWWMWVNICVFISNPRFWRLCIRAALPPPLAPCATQPLRLPLASFQSAPCD